MLLGALHKMLRKILSKVFNYDRNTRVEEESTPGSNPTREAGGSPASRSQVSDRRMVPPSNETKILPFPDPWDGDWNDSVINWVYWHENTKRKGEGQEPPEVGEAETD